MGNVPKMWPARFWTRDMVVSAGLVVAGLVLAFATSNGWFLVPGLAAVVVSCALATRDCVRTVRVRRWLRTPAPRDTLDDL